MTTADPKTGPVRGHVPGEPGLWVLIFGDLAIFAVMFVAYTAALVAEPGLFRASQATLDRGLGLLNTLLLLTSSWFIAQAVAAARTGLPRVRPLIVATIALGGAFVLVKVIEWSRHINTGHSLNSDSYFTFYFMYTGIHLLHVLIGLGVLIWLALRCDMDGRWSGSFPTLEGSAVFWHLVDLLWVMIFALIYLLH